MISRAHASALQRWAQTLEYSGTELWVDGVDCSRVDSRLSPIEFSARCQALVERTRRASTRRYVQIGGAR